jgi:protein TonB
MEQHRPASEGRHRFLTDAPQPRTIDGARTFSGLTFSLMGHLAALLVLSAVLARPASTQKPEAKFVSTGRVVYLAEPAGRGKRGGLGGGDTDPKPAGRIQLRGRDAVAMPRSRPVVPDASPILEPTNAPRVIVPDQLVESGLREAIGSVADVRPVDVDSRGPGSGPGADGEKGPGIGKRGSSGTGDDVGLGEDGEYGGARGNGVTWPRLLQEVKPNYTADAMRAKVEGLVGLEIVVLADGSVGRVSIVRSLDNRFGLDEAAITAVRRWRFEPGRRLGRAVPVRVGVEMSFNLR